MSASPCGGAIPIAAPRVARPGSFCVSKAREAALIQAYAGESGSHLVVLEELDTVDASTVDADLPGHSYFAETQTLLSDLFLLLRFGNPPDERKLPERLKDALKYWFIR